MADENPNMNKDKKQGQYGSGHGTQEREQNITGSSGVQNKQGQNINQGSTTGQKGGAGMGQQNQSAPDRNLQQGQKRPWDKKDAPTKSGQSSSLEAADETEDE